MLNSTWRAQSVFIADLLDNGDFSIGLCACRVEPHVDLTIASLVGQF